MFRFPFGTLQELNLDWIINKLREFAETGTKTPNSLTFTEAGGTTEEWDGSEPLTVDISGADTSNKLDKYTGGVDTLYATIGANQTNLPMPLSAQYGGTGVNSLAALKTALGLALEYVARRTTAGRWVYTHEAGVDGEKALSYTPDIDTIPCRTANSTVQTATPVAGDDAANKTYVDSGFVARRSTAQASAYGHSGSTEEEYPVRVDADPASIPYRDANGCVKTGTPQADADAATKLYVDSAMAPTYSPITSTKAGITFTAGGYWKIGKIVVINAVIQAAANTNLYNMWITGSTALPRAAMNAAENAFICNISVINTYNIISGLNNIGVIKSGGLYYQGPNFTFSSDTELILSGVYVAE